MPESSWASSQKVTKYSELKAGKGKRISGEDLKAEMDKNSKLKEKVEKDLKENKVDPKKDYTINEKGEIVEAGEDTDEKAEAEKGSDQDNTGALASAPDNNVGATLPEAQREAINNALKKLEKAGLKRNAMEEYMKGQIPTTTTDVSEKTKLGWIENYIEGGRFHEDDVKLYREAQTEWNNAVDNLRSVTGDSYRSDIVAQKVDEYTQRAVLDYRGEQGLHFLKEFATDMMPYIGQGKSALELAKGSELSWYRQALNSIDVATLGIAPARTLGALADVAGGMRRLDRIAVGVDQHALANRLGVSDAADYFKAQGELSRYYGSQDAVRNAEKIGENLSATTSISNTLSGKHAKTLNDIFDKSNGTRANIKWNDVKSLFESLGAKINEGRAGSRVAVTFPNRSGKPTTVIHSPHGKSGGSGTIKKSSVDSIRKFLLKNGIKP